MSDFLGFDRNGVQEIEHGTRKQPLEAGEYTLTAVAAALKDNKNRNGKFWEIRCRVEGHDDQEIVIRYNVQHENAQAAKIGQGNMVSFLRVLGCPDARNEEDLLHTPFRARLSIKERPWTVDGREVMIPYNEVEKLLPMKYDAPPPAAGVAANAGGTGEEEKPW